MRLSDKFTTGSSIMPQKRNPDAAELARAKVGRIAAAFQALLMVMKGLPLAYAKDMQEDKELTFDALASLRLTMAAMTGMVDDLEPNPEAMRAAAGAGFSTATDLGGLAGAGAGPAVPRGAPRHRPDRGRRGSQEACPWKSCLWQAMQAHRAPHHQAMFFDVLPVESSVKSRTSYGGTAPQNVGKMARGWIKRLEKERERSKDVQWPWEGCSLGAEWCCGL